ncbi:MAG TPA: TAXI family TRAP transporter solute-binding subunit [Burkholderiales bacterium]
MLHLELSRRDIALIVLPLAVLLAVAFWGAARYVQPAPPKVVVMGTGPIDGAYHAFAQRYKAVLAEYGVTLELVTSAGSVENLERLKSGQGGMSVALVQGGLANAENAPGLVTLGSVFYEPNWLFYKSKQTLDLGSQLRGKRIAIGAPGSGSRAVALHVFRETGLAEPPTVLREIGGLAAAKALEEGEVDAVFFMAAPDAPGVQRLLKAPGVRLLNTKRAEAFARRMPFLHKLTLPEGVVDPARNIPPKDITLLAVTANLVAVEDLHPVIVELILEAAKKVHGGPGLFQYLGEFPAPHDLDLPLSPDAERFYKSSPSVLRRYLPFWAAVWVNRFIVVVIPLLIVVIPVFRSIPALYRWRMRRNIYRWYGELRFTENAVRRGEGDPEAQLARLDRIEQRLDRMRVPIAYAAEFYILRSHIQWVRNLLREPPSKS